MRHLISPLLRLSACVCLCLGLLAACSSDSTQRQAFIQLLQARIVDSKANTAPALSASDTEKIGKKYAQQYALMEDFYRPYALPAAELMRDHNMIQLRYIAQQQQHIQDLQSRLSQLQTALDSSLTQAHTARATFKQASSLGPTYDTAYDLTLTQRARTIQDGFTALQAQLASLKQLAHFLESNHIQSSGNVFSTNDPQLHEQLQPLLKNLGENGRTLARHTEQYFDVLRGQYAASLKP